MRLGFWPPVYDNWIVSPRPEMFDASFAYAKKATLVAEHIGPLVKEMERFGGKVMPLLS